MRLAANPSAGTNDLRWARELQSSFRPPRLLVLSVRRLCFAEDIFHSWTTGGLLAAGIANMHGVGRRPGKICFCMISFLRRVNPGAPRLGVDFYPRRTCDSHCCGFLVSTHPRLPGYSQIPHKRREYVILIYTAYSS